MISTFEFIVLFLFGSLGGFLSCFLGIGGGIIYVPILDYFLAKYFSNSSELVKAVLANSLFIILFSATVASYKQYKMGNLFIKEIIQTMIPGVLSVTVFHYLINNGNWYSRKVFLYFFLVMLVVLVVKMLFSKNKILLETTTKAENYKYNITGAFAGIVTAMSGLGGGIIMTPIFTEWIKIDIKKASAISTGVIFCFSLAIGILNVNSKPQQITSEYQMGYIILPIALPLILGTFLFAQLGVKTALKAKSANIKLVFASFASIVLIKIIYEILILNSII